MIQKNIKKKSVYFKNKISTAHQFQKKNFFVAKHKLDFYFPAPQFQGLGSNHPFKTDANTRKGEYLVYAREWIAIKMLSNNNLPNNRASRITIIKCF